VAAGGARPAAERVELRRRMAQARMGPWREGVWVRPDNLGRPAWPESFAKGADDWCTWLVARLAGAESGDDATLAGAVWDLGQWASQAAALRQRMAGSVADLEAGRTEVLAPCFATAAAVVRHLQADPLLPDPLLPPGWPGAALRADYDRYEAAYRGALGGWLRGLAR
jgi:phenylacetic acid degradation operon negative regulatory protein